MKKVKFNVMCNAVYGGEMMVDNEASAEDALELVRSSLPVLPVNDLIWVADLEPDVAVTIDDIWFERPEGKLSEQEFSELFVYMLAKYPYISKDSLSLNELVFMLRQEIPDFSISDNLGGCIPSVKSSFVPSSWLSRKITAIEYDPEVNAESDTNVLCIEYLEEAENET